MFQQADSQISSFVKSQRGFFSHTINSVMNIDANKSNVPIVNQSSDPENNWTQKNWTNYLLKVSGIIVLGAVLTPNFSIGLIFGVVNLLISASIIVAANIISPIKHKENQPYHVFLKSNPIYAAIIAPIVEELLFRGVLLPILQVIIASLVPATTAIFICGGISVASAIAILATAIIIGAVHLGNKHNGAHRQALLCTIMGVSLGAISVQFGLFAAIAAHMINNTIAVTSFLSKTNGIVRS